MTEQVSGRGDSGWKARLRSLAPALRRRTPSAQGRSRGAAELSVLVVSGSLVAGVFFGQGISNTAVSVADGLTWISDGPNGQILQVNPATGKLEFKQLIGNDGDQIQVTAEHDGQLYVADHTTGRLLAFDLTSILVSGQRRITAGGAVDTLVNKDGVFLVDPEQSTIAAMDPVTTDAIGTIWVAQSGLADATTDGKGDIWALEDDGTLHRLTWSTDRLAFDDEEVEKVEGSGPGSVLVSHGKGVTVFGPDEGMVEQIGTDDARRSTAPKVIGDLYAPESSPADLVPVSSAGSGYVTLLTPDRLVEVDTSSMGCAKPGTPEVFHGQVHVPCLGEGRVVRLTADGQRGGDDILTPGSDDPELVLDDDNLIINAPGSGQGIVVHGDGRQSTIVREDADLPVNGLTSDGPAPGGPVNGLVDGLLDLVGNNTPPPSNPSTPTPPPSNPGSNPAPSNPGGNGNGNGGGTGGGTGGGPTAHGPRCNGGTGTGTGNGGASSTTGNGSPTSPSSSPTAPPSAPPAGKGKGKGKGCGGNGGGNGGGSGGGPNTGVGQPVSAPGAVAAVVQGEGQVLVTWTHSGIPVADAFVVRGSNGKAFPPVKGSARQALVDITPGEATSFTVTALLGDRQAVSSSSNTVTTTAKPGAPTVDTTASYRGNNDQEVFVVEVRWSGAPANGEAITAYDISVTTANGGLKVAQVPGNQNRIELTWTCSRALNADCKVGGEYSATVVARNRLGTGTPGVDKDKGPAPPAPPLPAAGKQVVDPGAPKQYDADDSGNGSFSLRLRPPADWARFPGTCSWTLDGANEQQVACNAGSINVTYANGTALEPSNGQFSHTVTFRARNDRGTAQSADFTFTTRQTVYTPGPDPATQDDGTGNGGGVPPGPYPEQAPNCYPYTCHIP